MSRASGRLQFAGIDVTSPKRPIPARPAIERCIANIIGLNSAEEALRIRAEFFPGRTPTPSRQLLFTSLSADDLLTLTIPRRAPCRGANPGHRVAAAPIRHPPALAWNFTSSRPSPVCNGLCPSLLTVMNRIHVITISCRRIIASCGVLTAGPGPRAEIPSGQTPQCPVAGPGSSLSRGGLSGSRKSHLEGASARAIALMLATSANVQQRSRAAQGTAKATPGRPWSAVNPPGPPKVRRAAHVHGSGQDRRGPAAWPASPSATEGRATIPRRSSLSRMWEPARTDRKGDGRRACKGTTPLTTNGYPRPRVFPCLLQGRELHRRGARGPYRSVGDVMRYRPLGAGSRDTAIRPYCHSESPNRTGSCAEGGRSADYRRGPGRPGGSRRRLWPGPRHCHARKHPAHGSA